PRATELYSMRLLFIEQRLDEWAALSGKDIRCDEIGCAIRVLTQRGSEVLVEIISANKIVSNFEVRIVEAIRYVLARVVQVSVIERCAEDVVETELISRVRASETRLFPPLNARSSDDRANVRLLFKRYLTFVHSQTSSEFVHPCSVFLRNACEASANAIDAEVIGLCVAVEGIAKLVPYERSTLDDEAFAQIRRVIAKWLEKRRFSSGIKNRVLGLLSQLKSDTVQKRLEPLINTGQL